MVGPQMTKEEIPSGALIFAGSLVYAALAAAAGIWLWLRDRTDVVVEQSIGPHGLWVSIGSGLAVGLGVSGVASLLTRYSGAFSRLQQRLATMIGPLRDGQILVLALVSSVGEEFFFRLAMQDALGLWWTVAIFGLLHSGPRGLLLWTVLALMLGALFGVMMECGLGLLSVTLAHALINFLSLNRMQ